MIIGVDESGDFSVGSRTVFAAVFLRPSQRDVVVAAQRRWEKAARRDLGLHGELKGAALTARWIEAFINEVLSASSAPVRYLAFAVDMDAQSRAAMEVQQERLVTGYEDWAEQVRSRSDGEERKFATALDQTADWARRLSHISLLKLMTLGRIVPELVEWAIAVSIMQQFDHELDRLTVMIDRGYVKEDDLFRWRDILRNTFIGYTHDNPLPTLETWNDDHAFMKKFIAEHRGEGGLLLTPAFKEMIDFHNSEAAPEVRIADVVAAVARREEVGRERFACYQPFRTFSLIPERYKQIEWTTSVRTSSWDPYASPKEPPSPTAT